MDQENETLTSADGKVKWPRWKSGLYSVVTRGALTFAKDVDAVNPNIVLDGPTLSEGWIFLLHTLFGLCKNPPVKDFGPWETPEKKLAWILRAENSFEPVNPDSKKAKQWAKYWGDKKEKFGKPNIDTTMGSSSRLLNHYFIHGGIVFDHFTCPIFRHTIPQEVMISTSYIPENGAPSYATQPMITSTSEDHTDEMKPSSHPKITTSTGESTGQKKKKNRRPLNKNKSLESRLAGMRLEDSVDGSAVAKKEREAARVAQKLKLRRKQSAGGDSGEEAEVEDEDDLMEDE